MASGESARSHLRLVFTDATCLPALRRWLRDHLSAGEDRELDAQLVCTEMVTNAVEHGRAPFEVRLEVLARSDVRVEVDDADVTAELTVGRSRLGRFRGRGLVLVDELATWGVIRIPPTGKTVWATL